MGVSVKSDGECAFQVGTQGFELRRQARLRLAFGPHEFVTKLGQAGRLAFFPHDQFVAQHIFPALELAPHMAVRQTEFTCSGGDRAMLRHRLQQIHQGMTQ